MKRMAETAPSGATDIEIPFGDSIWSILPNIAIAANAPTQTQDLIKKPKQMVLNSLFC